MVYPIWAYYAGITLGYKFDKNNAAIIGCLQAYLIKELSETEITGCNEIYQTLL